MSDSPLPPILAGFFALGLVLVVGGTMIVWALVAIDPGPAEAEPVVELPQWERVGSQFDRIETDEVVCFEGRSTRAMWCHWKGDEDDR